MQESPMQESPMQESSEPVEDIARGPATADERRTDRVRSWRRRVLQRRGALMHAAMARGREDSSLAMLWIVTSRSFIYRDRSPAISRFVTCVLLL
jgi:hypothetical protein